MSKLTQINVPTVGQVWIECDPPSPEQLSVANALPGLMQMMPTHTTRLYARTWTIHKIKPEAFDESPYIDSSNGYPVVVLSDTRSKAYEDWHHKVATGDKEIDDYRNTDMLAIADVMSLDEDQIEHAEDNTGFSRGNNIVCLEYVGCESSSNNWYPDHRDTSIKVAFTDKEIHAILSYLDSNPLVLP